MAEPADRSGRKRRRWPFLFIAFLALASLLLHAAKSRRQGEVVRLSRQYADLVRAKPIAGTRERRSRYYRLRFLLAHPQAVSFAAADFVRRVHALAPPLRLLSCRIDPGLHDLEFRLTVGVAAASSGAAQLRFEAFFGRLEMMAGLIEAGSAAEGRRRDGLHVFSARGRAELP